MHYHALPHFVLVLVRSLILELMIASLGPLEAVAPPRAVIMWTSTSKQLRHAYGFAAKTARIRAFERLHHASLLKHHMAVMHRPFLERRAGRHMAMRQPTQLEHYQSVLKEGVQWRQEVRLFYATDVMRNYLTRMARMAPYEVRVWTIDVLEMLHPPHLQLERSTGARLVHRSAPKVLPSSIRTGKPRGYWSSRWYSDLLPREVSSQGLHADFEQDEAQEVVPSHKKRKDWHLYRHRLDIALQRVCLHARRHTN